MVTEETETCSHTRILMVVYVVVFGRNKSVDFLLRMRRHLLYPDSRPDIFPYFSDIYNQIDIFCCPGDHYTLEKPSPRSKNKMAIILSDHCRL